MTPQSLTDQCAQEILWSMEDSGNPNPDIWEHISDYVDCGPVEHKGKSYHLDGDDVYDAIMKIKRSSK